MLAITLHSIGLRILHLGLAFLRRFTIKNITKISYLYSLTFICCFSKEIRFYYDGEDNSFGY